MGITAVVVRRPITIAMVFVGLTILGLATLMQLPIELMPNTSYPVVTININYPGVPPTEVESMVTVKVEESVATAAHLRNIESSSEDGKSETILEFEPGTDMNFAALEVREKFAKVRNKLPEGIRKPILGKYDVADAPIIILAMLSDTVATEYMREIADKELKEPLNRVTGVSNVEVSGGRERKILVEVDQSRLQSYGLSIEHIVKVLHDNNVNLLAGNYERGDYRYLVRAIGQFSSVNGIKQIGVAATQEGMIIRLGDIAKVTDSFLEAAGYARYDTADTVSLYIHKERQANTIEVCDGVKAAVKELEKKLRTGVRMVMVLDQSEGIKTAIETVKDSLVEGSILSAAVLFVTFRSIRGPAIMAVALPLAMIATFIPMFFLKLTINTMTLSGLALASGNLIDASIVVMDNVIKKNQGGMPMKEAVVVGTEEVGLAIVASTITTVVVFLPIIFVNKEVRMLYEGLAMTVIFSLMASLLVAQTLVPVLAARWLKEEKEVKKVWVYRNKPPLTHIALTVYRHLLTLSIRYRYPFAGILLVLLGLSAFLNTKLGSEFMGSVEQNKVTVNLTLPAGTKLDISNDIVKRVERFLAKVPEIDSLSSLVEQNRSEIHVEFKPAAQRRRSTKEILDDLRPQLVQFRPAYVYFEEKQEVGTKTLVLDLFGYDYVILKQLAISIANRMETLPGMTDVRIRMKEGRPEMRFLVDKAKAAGFDLNVKTLAEEINTQMRGVIATNYHTESMEIETIVRLQEQFRKTLDDVNKLTVAAPNGDQIYLSQIGTFSPGLGPSEIWRKNKSRMIQTSATVSTDLGTAVNKVRDALTAIDFPKGYYYRFGGNYEKMVESSKQLSLAVILTVVLIYMVLAAFFESYTQPLIIMISVVLAIIGVVLALYIAGKPKSVGVFMGLLMLAGMVVSPAIILVDTINQLTSEGMNVLKAALTASQSRIRPIWLTVSTTVLGLLPMAVDTSESSNLWSPLAITVEGGVIVSTILTLLYVPSMYLMFADVKKLSQRVLGWVRHKIIGTATVQTTQHGPA